MIITYFRSSSFNDHRLCEQLYFLNYCLGWSGPSGKKAIMGTVCHKVLEICAVCKKFFKKKKINDDIVGEVITNNYDKDYLTEIINKVCNYYFTNSPHVTWSDKDRMDCHKWVWKILEYGDGLFDPRNRKVIDAEPFFDFEIDKKWAEYSYGDIKGRLRLKGTIDLVTDVGGGVVEVIDWKTGRRRDWATGASKDYNKLYNDPQLRLYHLACKHLYPKCKAFLITIGFINDGGFFTLNFTDDNLDETLTMIKNRFEKIRDTDKPKLNKTWKCTKFCHQGMSTFENTNIRAIKEHRLGQVCRKGSVMTKCEQTKYMIDKMGTDWVQENCKKEGFQLDSYRNPGGV